MFLAEFECAERASSCPYDFVGYSIHLIRIAKRSARLPGKIRELWEKLLFAQRDWCCRVV